MKAVKLLFVLSIIVMLSFQTFCFGQGVGKPPYPIIFIHGYAGDETTWMDSDGNWKTLFEGYGWQNGGIIHICLENQKVSLHDIAIYDIGVKNVSPPTTSGDFYFLNFDINYDGDIHPDNRFKISCNSNPNIFHVIEGYNYNIHENDILAYDETPYTEFMKVTYADPINNNFVVQRGWGPSPANYINDIFYIRDHSNLSNQASAVKQGIAVKLAIQKVKELNLGVSKVILVCHSMGGLAARQYIQSDDYELNEDVAMILTVDSPHLGSNMSDLDLLFPNFMNYDSRSDAVRD